MAHLTPPDLAPLRAVVAPRVSLCNALATSMLADPRSSLEIREIDLVEARALAVDAVSFVGHPETASRYAELLGRPVEAHRGQLTLGRGDILLVGQHDQSRLPEGATSLPTTAGFRWLRITRVE